LPIAARDLAYNAARKELYASVAGDAAAYPNRIVVIDPSTSSVVSTIPIGSNPRTLAVSDDGATLWVGIDGAHAFRKVTLGSTPVVGPLIHLPKAMPTTYYDAYAMAVLPGAPSSLAVALYDGYSGDVRVFDDGVSRGGGATNGLVAYSLAAGPPGLLFGAGSYGLLVLRVGASGIPTATPFYNLLRGYSSSLVYAAGRVFAQTGEVLDVSNPNAPFWSASLGAQGPVALRDPQSLLQLTTTNSSTFPFTQRTDIRITATGMLTPIGSVPVPTTVAPNGAYCRDLIYAGGDAVAFVASDYSGYTENPRLAIIHDPAFGTPIGGSGGGPGGTGGTGGAGGIGGAGGTGGAPNPCPGCSVATVPAYGLHMAADASRNLIYVAAHAQAVSHPSSIVTVDAAAAAVTSIVPVGNDPQPLALSDDASALWVGLAGDHRVRRMTPGTTPVPGPAYALPMLLTTNEPASPFSVVVLPGMPGSIAVGVYGANLGGRGVFILDDGLLRANYVQPPEVPAYFLTNGPPGYLLGLGDYGNLVAFRLGSVGATYETYGGLITGGSYGLIYSAGYLYSSTGEVVDLRNPDDPMLNGRFAFNNCLLALRSATRVMMVCPTSDPTGPIMHMLDPDTFTSVGSVTLPPSLQAASWVDFAYLGGDGVALLADGLPLQIMHAPLIGSPP
jgi:YVTN family beta-propeller protein